MKYFFLLITNKKEEDIIEFDCKEGIYNQLISDTKQVYDLLCQFSMKNLNDTLIERYNWTN